MFGVAVAAYLAGYRRHELVVDLVLNLMGHVDGPGSFELVILLSVVEVLSWPGTYAAGALLEAVDPRLEDAALLGHLYHLQPVVRGSRD